jgi:hypothetical protein
MEPWVNLEKEIEEESTKNLTGTGQHSENLRIEEQATRDELEWAFEKGALNLNEALTMISQK